MSPQHHQPKNLCPQILFSMSRQSVEKVSKRDSDHFFMPKIFFFSKNISLSHCV